VEQTTTPRRNHGVVCRLAGRGERIRTSGLYVPNVALYQAKLHPEGHFRFRGRR
jgi:hypothetical protein